MTGQEYAVERELTPDEIAAWHIDVSAEYVGYPLLNVSGVYCCTIKRMFVGEQKYEYPYTYMTFDCLFLVYQMPDRLELLKIGEERAMGYSTFVDYIFNHVLCSNEESDTEEYKIMYPFNNLPPYIKYENYAANIRNRPKRKRRKKT